MPEHPHITNLELCFQNKNPLNNLDNRITLLYKYAWTAVSLPAQSCHLQVTMVIDFERDL